MFHLSLVLIAAAAVVCSPLASAATDLVAPPRPNISKAYRTSCSLTTDLNGGPKTMGGFMVVDDSVKKFYFTFQDHMFGSDNYTISIERYCHGDHGNSTMSGQCRPSSETPCYSNYFAFVPYAQFTGKKTLDDGSECNNWELHAKYSNLSLCVDLSNADIPKQFSIHAENPILRVASIPTIFRYHTFVPVPPGSLEINRPDSCAYTPYSCPSGPVVNRTMWRLHSKTDYSLVNKNVASLTGDALFLCLFVRQNNTAFLGDSLFSAFNTTVNTTWSQYSLCNVDKNDPSGYRCVGSEGQPTQVGREAAYAALPNSGQCQPADKNIGEWFSFRDTANHPSGWTEVARIKSIDATCMLTPELYAACNEFPYTKAADVVTKAFKTCKDVPPPTGTSKVSKRRTDVGDDTMVRVKEAVGDRLKHKASLEALFGEIAKATSRVERAV